MKLVDEIRAELSNSADENRARVSRRFFKTGPGEYGEGDRFIGVKVPVLRKLSRKYKDADLNTVLLLLGSQIHEERQLALFILVLMYKASDSTARKRIFNLYLDNIEHVNNWDLVDCSAEHIVGAYILGGDKKLLYELARSKELWERRVSIMATYHYIKKGMFDETLQIARMLVEDKEDLIQKAVGWMLREVGKRDLSSEEAFLKKHYKTMPRTMLRYAIERFPEPKRKAYLEGSI